MGRWSTELQGVKPGKNWHVHKLVTGANAGTVPFLPNQSIRTTPACTVFMVKKHIMCCLSQAIPKSNAHVDDISHEACMQCWPLPESMACN
jgi:hypothetical protein